MQPLANCGYTEVITIFYLPCVPKFWGRAYFVQGRRHIWSHHYFLQQVLAHQWKISQRRFQKNSPHHQKKSPIRHETPTKHMDSKVNIVFYMKTNKTNENQDILSTWWLERSITIFCYNLWAAFHGTNKSILPLHPLENRESQ